MTPMRTTPSLVVSFCTISPLHLLHLESRGRLSVPDASDAYMRHSIAGGVIMFHADRCGQRRDIGAEKATVGYALFAVEAFSISPLHLLQ